MTVVSDACPLHYLVLIKADHVLAQLFSEVVVPPAVLRELSHERAPGRVRHWASHSPRSSKLLSEFAHHCWPLSSPTSNTVAPKAHSNASSRTLFTYRIRYMIPASENEQQKSFIWLHGRVKTPSFTPSRRTVTP
jgi:hypothetical protein